MILKCQLGRALCCLFNALPYGIVAKGVDPPDRSPCTLAGPAASYIELDGRIARLDAWHEGGGDSNVYAAAMQGYADNRILLDQWSAIANREAVNVLASVNGGIDFAKGAWRLANGEVNWENGLSVGAAILGPLTGRVGKTFSLGRKVVAAESGAPGAWRVVNDLCRGMAARGRCQPCRAIILSLQRFAVWLRHRRGDRSPGSFPMKAGMPVGSSLGRPQKARFYMDISLVQSCRLPIKPSWKTCDQIQRSLR